MRLASVVPIVAIALTGVGLDLHRGQAADLLGPAPPPPRGYGFDYAPVPSESAPIPPASVYEAPRYVVPDTQAYEPRVQIAPVPSYAQIRQCYWAQGDWVWNGYAWAQQPVQICN